MLKKRAAKAVMDVAVKILNDVTDAVISAFIFESNNDQWCKCSLRSHYFSSRDELAIHNQCDVQIKFDERMLQDECTDVEVKFGNDNTNENEGSMRVMYQSR